MKKLFLALIFIPAISFGAEITITIPDEVAPRVLDAFASKYDWDGTGTKAQFAKRIVAQWIKQIVVEEEAMLAKEAAQQQADSEIEVE